LRELLAASRPQHWADARQWLFFTLAIGCLPFWGVALILWLFSQSVDPRIFVQHAELVVYSAGLLAPAIPLIQREIKDSPHKHPRWFLGVAVFMLAAAAVVLASVSLADKFKFSLPVNADRLLWLSAVIFVASLTMGFLVEVIHNIRLDPDVRAMKDKQLDDLSAKVGKKLGEQRGE